MEINWQEIKNELKTNSVFFNHSLNNIRILIKELSLRDFIDLYIYSFDKEAINKKWRTTKLQEEMGEIWEKYQKSCILAPREHLKTTTVLAYLIKKIAERKYPLEIVYFHLISELAEEKFNKLKRIIENNPLLNRILQLDEKITWKEDIIRLKDGTMIRPLSYGQGTIGRHPHIIVLDDIIDRRVIYSDEQNKKTIDKFYTDIYPMITKEEKDKQIIMIGTAQRKDDIYHRLPKDFYFKKYQAIIDDEKKIILSPEIFTYEKLIEIKKNISEKFGEKYWLKEYMNIPFEAMGLIIKPENINYYKELPPKLEIYQGWDLSVGKDIEKGDWTVGITIGVDRSLEKHRIYVLDVYRNRIDFNTRLNMIYQKYMEYKPLAVGIESVAFQYDLIKLLKDKMIPITEIKSIKNKVERFQVELAPYFENNQVFIKEYMKDLENELLSLPVGDYDDQADALDFAIKTALYSYKSPKFYILSF